MYGCLSTTSSFQKQLLIKKNNPKRMQELIKTEGTSKIRRLDIGNTELTSGELSLQKADQIGATVPSHQGSAMRVAVFVIVGSDNVLWREGCSNETGCENDHETKGGREEREGVHLHRHLPRRHHLLHHWQQLPGRRDHHQRWATNPEMYTNAAFQHQSETSSMIFDPTYSNNGVIQLCPERAQKFPPIHIMAKSWAPNSTGMAFMKVGYQASGIDIKHAWIIF
jgi:hypothetical protein